MLRKLLFLLTYPRNLKYSMKDAPNNIFIIINFFKIIISNLFLSFSFNWWLVFLNPPLNPSGSQPQTCLEQCSSCSESDPWCRYTIWVNPFWTPNWVTIEPRLLEILGQILYFEWLPSMVLFLIPTRSLGCQGSTPCPCRRCRGWWCWRFWERWTSVKCWWRWIHSGWLQCWTLWFWKC